MQKSCRRVLLLFTRIAPSLVTGTDKKYWNYDFGTETDLTFRLAWGPDFGQHESQMKTKFLYSKLSIQNNIKFLRFQCCLAKIIIKFGAVFCQKPVLLQFCVFWAFFFYLCIFFGKNYFPLMLGFVQNLSLCRSNDNPWP